MIDNLQASRELDGKPMLAACAFPKPICTWQMTVLSCTFCSSKQSSLISQLTLKTVVKGWSDKSAGSESDTQTSTAPLESSNYGLGFRTLQIHHQCSKVICQPLHYSN
jgi:hypothetical protein